MAELLNRAGAWLTPPTEAWWYGPLAAALLGALAVGLALARGAGAAGWQVADDDRRQKLREWCLEALRGEGPQAEAPRAGADRLPEWVRGSVELTVVRGLLLRDNVTWAGVRTAGADPA